VNDEANNGLHVQGQALLSAQEETALLPRESGDICQDDATGKRTSRACTQHNESKEEPQHKRSMSHRKQPDDDTTHGDRD
jgi:hypothetical protein